MSKLKISQNLFLEVNELNKMIHFLQEDGYKSFFKHLPKSFGIAQNENNTYFKVSRKSETQNKVIINSGIAFDPDLNRIYLAEDKELEIPNTGENQWILISYVSTNDEEGTVNISAQGTLSGVGTKFTSVLRGQPNFPTKVKFNSAINNEEYEVVDVTSDTVATLSGSFAAEQGLKYQVIGTFTPGFQPDNDDKTIYEYDSCRIDIVESKDKPNLSDGQYIIAKISYIDDIINISDERTQNIFNYKENEINEDATNPFVALRQTTIRANQMLDIQFEWGYTVNRFELVTSAKQNIFKIITGISKFIQSNEIPDGIFDGWLLVNRKNMISVIIDHNVNHNLYITEFNPFIVTDQEDDEFVIVPNVKDIEVEITLEKISSSVLKSNSIVSKVDLSDVAINSVLQTQKPNLSLQDITSFWRENLNTSAFLKYNISNDVIIGTVDKSSISKEDLALLLDNEDYGTTKLFFKFSIENVASRFSFPLDYGQTLVTLRYRIMSSSKTTKFQPFANSQFKNINDETETLGDSSFIVIVNKPAEQRNYS